MSRSRAFRRAALVVTADDFGLSPAVNRGILAAHRYGPVRATTLLTNLPGFESASGRLRRAPELEVGIHLNLTCGHPVLPPDEVPSLVRPGGAFPSLFGLSRRLLAGAVDAREVKREWAAQIERGRRSGWEFRFLSSHQHVHMHPRLASVAAELARASGIAAVRVARFPAVGRDASLHAWLLRPLVRGARRAASRQRLSYNEWALEWRMDRASPLEDLGRRIRRLPPGFHELIVHPGFVDDALRARDPYTEPRRRELDLLASPAALDMLNRTSVRLEGWASLRASVPRTRTRVALP